MMQGKMGVLYNDPGGCHRVHGGPTAVGNPGLQLL